MLVPFFPILAIFEITKVIVLGLLQCICFIFSLTEQFLFPHVFKCSSCEVGRPHCRFWRRPETRGAGKIHLCLLGEILYIRARQRMHICIHTYMHTRQRNILAYMHTDIYAYIHIYIHTYTTATRQHTYIHTHETYTHTHIHSKHTYMYTYNHTQRYRDMLHE
jgi:hypothetical protein